MQNLRCLSDVKDSVIFDFLHHLIFKLAFSVRCKDEKLNCLLQTIINNSVTYCVTVHHKAVCYIGQ